VVYLKAIAVLALVWPAIALGTVLALTLTLIDHLERAQD